MGNFEKMARRLAEQYVRKGYENGNAELDEAATRILDATAPLTMEDVEWEDEKHRFAGATFDGSDDVVMLEAGEFRISVFDLEDEESFWTDHGYLVPNGKKYELREVTDKPEHPEVLHTVEDYENAPQGTIVALADSPPWSKTPSGGWRQAGDYRTSPEMVGVKRKMLRWGWGE